MNSSRQASGMTIISSVCCTEENPMEDALFAVFTSLKDTTIYRQGHPGAAESIPDFRYNLTRLTTNNPVLVSPASSSNLWRSDKIRLPLLGA
jgi:hypothetical protein